MRDLPDPLRLLLLADPLPDWRSAVRDFAASNGATLVNAENATDAMGRLSAERDHFSHALIAAPLIEAHADEFIGLTIGEPSARTRLVVLGSRDGLPPGLAVASAATPTAIAQAVAAATGAATGGDPVPLDELRSAIASSRFTVLFQPIISLPDGQLTAVEALARLQHPRRGTIPPDLFIPDLEAAGLAKPLGAIVAGLACADAALLVDGQGSLRIAVNLSLDALLSEQIVGALQNACRLSGNLISLSIELTERTPVTDVTALARRVREVQDHGYPVALDDVCAETPELEALLDKVPFNTIKLDKSVLADPVFLNRVVVRAHQARMRVVAEGVDSLSVLTAMQRAGADEVQGFWIGRPLPAGALAAWRHAWQRDTAALFAQFSP